MQVKRAELKAALAAAGKVVSNRPGIPALTGVKLTADDAALTLECTDLEASYRRTIDPAGPVNDRAESWTVLVPRKLLAAAIKAGGPTVDLEPAGEVLKVGPGAIRLLDVEDFPTLTEPGEVFANIDAPAFVAVMGEVLPAASTDEARPVLTGVLLESHDVYQLEVTATDSYRLHHGELLGGVAGPERKLIVPGRTLRAVVGILGRKSAGVVTCRGDVDESAVAFELPDGSRITTRLIDGEYPNWRQLVPDKGGEVAAIADVTPELIAAVAGAEPFCGDAAPVHVLIGYGFAEVSARSVDLGSYVQRVEVPTTGTDITTAYNPGYLGAALKLGGRLEVRDGLKPCIVRATSGAVALVMPVRMPGPLPKDEPAADPAPKPEAATSEAPEPTADVPEPEPAEEPTEPAEPTAEARELERRATQRDRDAASGAAIAAEHDERDVEPAEPEHVAAARMAAGVAEPWAVLATVMEVGPVRVRVVVGPDGEPWVDCRRFSDSKRYSGPTRKGLAVDRSAAVALAVAYGHAVDIIDALDDGRSPEGVG